MAETPISLFATLWWGPGPHPQDGSQENGQTHTCHDSMSWPGQDKSQPSFKLLTPCYTLISLEMRGPKPPVTSLSEALGYHGD